MSSVSGSGERILAILDLFSEDRPGWTSEEMMEELGYSRPTLYRYLKTLKDAGYLAPLSSGGFTLGPKVTELDFLMSRADPLIRHGQPELGPIAERFPGSAFLTRWYGGRLLCVASVVSAASPRSSYPRGRPMPIGRGAASRAIAAALPLRDRRRLVEAHLSDFTGVGVGGSIEDVMAVLRQVRRDGLAVAWGEVTPGVVAVAAPILTGDPTSVGALCLSSDQATMSPGRLEAITTSVREAAGRINDALSGDRDDSESAA